MKTRCILLLCSSLFVLATTLFSCEREGASAAYFRRVTIGFGRDKKIELKQFSILDQESWTTDSLYIYTYGLQGYKMEYQLPRQEENKAALLIAYDLEDLTADSIPLYVQAYKRYRLGAGREFWVYELRQQRASLDDPLYYVSVDYGFLYEKTQSLPRSYMEHFSKNDSLNLLVSLLKEGE